MNSAVCTVQSATAGGPSPALVAMHVCVHVRAWHVRAVLLHVTYSALLSPSLTAFTSLSLMLSLITSKSPPPPLPFFPFLSPDSPKNCPPPHCCHPSHPQAFSAYPHPFSGSLLTSRLCSCSPFPNFHPNLFHFSCCPYHPSSLSGVSVKPGKSRDQRIRT